jgi:hypothetical protein
LRQNCPSIVGLKGNRLKVTPGSRIRGSRVPGRWTKNSKTAIGKSGLYRNPTPIATCTTPRRGTNTPGGKNGTTPPISWAVGEVPSTFGKPNQIKMTPKEILSRKCPCFCAQRTIRSSNLLYDVTVLVHPAQTLGYRRFFHSLLC